jgi:uncharacterized protein
MRSRLAKRRWAPLVFAGAIVALGLDAFWLEPASLTIVEERIAIDSIARGSVRVAILTDLHVGSPFNGIERLRALVARTNAARPDVVCVLGDLVIQGVIGGHPAPPEAIAAELTALRAPSGVFAVLGNHDGWLDHDRVQRALEDARIRVIEESSAPVHTPAGPIWLAGISDWWTGRHDITAALAGVADDGRPVILMTHNPDVFPQVPSRVSLTLAGHTHGGQVRLPLLGAPIVPSQFGARYAAGHIVEAGRHLYVATGVGTSILPVRFRVPPAVVVLTLTPR